MGSWIAASPKANLQREHCCLHSCVPHSPRRSCSQHFVVLPSLLTVPPRSDHKDDDRENEKGTACPDQCQGTDAGSREHTASATGDTKDAAESSRKSEARRESPWEFSVDVKGCDEVRAMTERGMLVVKGQGSSDTSQQMVRYITSLPSHVTHDSLTARLTNGRLTVTQKAAAQLQCQARTLPINVQRHTSPELEKHHHHQVSPVPKHQPEDQEDEAANTDGTEKKEKDISSADDTQVNK